MPSLSRTLCSFSFPSLAIALSLLACTDEDDIDLRALQNNAGAAGTADKGGAGGSSGGSSAGKGGDAGTPAGTAFRWSRART
jgi:hypothetical protein